MARNEKRLPESARPPQGHPVLVMDYPASSVTAAECIENLRAALAPVAAEGTDDAAKRRAARVRAMLSSLRASHVVEATAEHLVFALPAPGSKQADELVDLCAETMFVNQPWPTVTGKPPIDWHDAKIQLLDQVVLLKKLALVCLTAAARYVQTWERPAAEREECSK